MHTRLQTYFQFISNNYYKKSSFFVLYKIRCPFAGPLSFGQNRAEQINATKYLLINNGYTIEEGEVIQLRLIFLHYYINKLHLLALL